MKGHLLSNMLAAIAALCIVIFALQQKAQAQMISILGTDYYKSAQMRLSTWADFTMLDIMEIAELTRR